MIGRAHGSGYVHSSRLCPSHSLKQQQSVAPGVGGTNIHFLVLYTIFHTKYSYPLPTIPIPYQLFLTNYSYSLPTIPIPYQLFLFLTNYSYSLPTIPIPYQLLLFLTNYCYSLPTIPIPYQLFLFPTNYSYSLPTISYQLFHTTLHAILYHLHANSIPIRVFLGREGGICPPPPLEDFVLPP